MTEHNVIRWDAAKKRGTLMFDSHESDGQLPRADGEHASVFTQPEDRDYFVKQLQSGDDTSQRKAFEEWVTRHWVELVCLCQRLCRNRQTAEDLAQETLVKVWNKRFQCMATTEERFSRWVFFIAKRKAYEHGRSNRIRRVMQMVSTAETGIEPSTEPAACIDNVEMGDLAARIRCLVWRFPPRWSKAFLLKIDGGMTFEQIGSELQVNARTVRKWMNTMQATIRQWLDCE